MPKRLRSEREYVTTYTAGGNAFHWVMVVCTGGAWLLVWPFFRRKRVTRARTYDVR